MARLARLPGRSLEAGGNVGALAIAGPRLGYVVVSMEDWTSRVLAFDPAEARVLRETWSTRDLVPEIEVDGGYEDREAPGGLPTTFVPGRNLLFLAAAVNAAPPNTDVVLDDFESARQIRRVDAGIRRSEPVLSDGHPFQIEDHPGLCG